VTTHVITFYTSGSGNPAVDLSPVATVIDVTTTLIVTQSEMASIGLGFYSFEFLQYTGSNDYAIRIDGRDSNLDYRFTIAGNESFVDDIWGANVENHHISGSFGSAIRDINDIEMGSWRLLSDGTMELLRSGSNELIARFNLQDITGINITDPTTQDPFRRSRV
jgi:hypothetical protein